jgi:TonB family protein
MTRKAALVVVLAFGMGLVSWAQSSQGSEQDLLRRLAAQPADLAAQLDLVKLYAAQGRLAEAEQVLTRAITQVRQQRQIRESAVLAPQPAPARIGQPYTVAGVVPRRIGGEVKEPKKIRDVKPVYPAIAQSAHVQGVVILEVVIDPSGLVHDAKILRSLPLLDQAALDAVRQWEFTPTVVDGMAVPVIMTVTVNFTLN